MILDGVCYPIIHFCRVILSRMVEPSCSQSFMVFYQTPVSLLQYYSTIPSFQDSEPFPLARVFKHTSNLDVEGCPNRPRNWSKAVPEGNDPTPQQKEFGSGQPTLADVYRVMKERFDQSDKYWDSVKSHFHQQERKLDELMEMTRRANQHVASLEQDARQPRLAMEADGQADTKTCERTEGAAKAVQAMYGDSCPANRVDPDLMCSTSFGGDPTGPSALPCSRDNALVGHGAAAPKSYLSPLEMRSPTAAGGLLPAGMTTTATRTTFHQLPLWFCLTEETNPRTLILCIFYFSGFGWINNQAASFWSRLLKQNRGKIWCLIQEGR